MDNTNNSARGRLQEGISFTSRLIVGEGDTAISMGSGTLPVLGTPRLAALLENAAMLAVAPVLAPGETTVGSELSLRHLAPSGVGASITATAVLEKAEGRKLYFKVCAREGDILIGEGTHTRFIVDAERFLSKIHPQ